MSNRTKSVLLILALLAGTAILISERRRPRGQQAMLELRETLRTLRASADSCRIAVERDASRFEAFDHTLDSLRARVDSLESIDPRGVPADSYATYLEAFDRYNDSIAGWTRRADSLRVRDARCREIAELHNVLADSLRMMLVRQLEDARNQ